MTCKKYYKEYYKKQREAGRCVDCVEPAMPGYRLCKYHHEQHLEYSKKSKQKMKAIVIEAYGGACYCCGETAEAFLTLDHINQDGASHRRSNRGMNLWQWAKKNGFPSSLRLACWNCNLGAFYNNGICPHGP